MRGPFRGETTSSEVRRNENSVHAFMVVNATDLRLVRDAGDDALLRR